MENNRLDSHLELLRNEHLQLQARFANLQRQYDILVASAPSDNGTFSPTQSFVHKLVSIVSDLYNKDLYSDITIHCDGHQLRGHRFVIASRTEHWGDLADLEHIDFPGMTYSVGCTLLKWMYTDCLDIHLGDDFLIDLLSAAADCQLENLQQRCELMLVGRLEIKNCLKFYELSKNRNLKHLGDACNHLLSAHWGDFGPKDFEGLSASLVYSILKNHSKHLVHSIVRLRREDVLFLFFVDHDAQAFGGCNEIDERGMLPLELALDAKQSRIAASLIAHGADVNMADKVGKSLLMKAIEKDQVESCDFLVRNGAKMDFKTADTSETLLHTLAKSNCSKEMFQWFKAKIPSLDVNAVDGELASPLIRAVERNNEKAANFLLRCPSVNADLADVDGRTSLWIALTEKRNISMASALIEVGANINMVWKGENLVHYAARARDLVTLQFLCKNHADMNVPNDEGLCALHLAAKRLPCDTDTVRLLLKAGADPSRKAVNTGATLLHMLVDCENGAEVLAAIKNEIKSKSFPFYTPDNEGNSVLAKALLKGNVKCAEILLELGADINERSGEGNTLLVRALLSCDDQAALFLLNHGADAAVNSSEGSSCLELAVEFALLGTVRFLCKSGANLNSKNRITGLPPLWKAIENEAFDVASVLVEHGCDLDGWAPSDTEGTCQQTMLHRAIDLNLKNAAIFLIKSGCSLNVLKKYRDKNDDDRRTPLHSCISWHLNEVAISLIESGAMLDLQDSDGRTAVHLAVLEQCEQVLYQLLSACDPSGLLLRDRYGVTPLVLAMQSRNNNAARAIVNKAPHAAMQMNANGENLLHTAVKAADLENVLFLLGLHVDVNVCTQDAYRFTALHISAQSGNEMIMRNLLLAGAKVDAASAKGYTALHVAAYHNHGKLCAVLLENGAQPNVCDRMGNNALHAAVSQGSVSAVKTLLAESQIDIRALNLKHQTPLFLAAGCVIRTRAVEILNMVMKADPQYPVEEKDANGNTLFLLAYITGNAELCKAALSYDVCLATTNNFGISVFNYETPTKQLLFSLLDSLTKEPKWADGDTCSECSVRFTLTVRKHHCRHCGRLVCSRCSENSMPILKFGLQKPVRVCQICSDVLTIGIGH